MLILPLRSSKIHTAYKKEQDVPRVLWDALVSVYHRHASRDAAMKAAVEVRKKPVRAPGALMALWRRVVGGDLPLNATDTAWRVREAIPRFCGDLARSRRFQAPSG